MKKSGFTLAEVLITLGIVGVVSALVLPTFTTKMQTAKVGPRLAKAVAGFEQANIAILDDAQSDSLSGAVFTDQEMVLKSSMKYFRDVLPTHMKGSYDNSKHKFYSADGVSYCIIKVNGRSNPGQNPLGESDYAFDDVVDNEFPHLRAIAGVAKTALMIDIDGNNGPGAASRDLFFFQMMDDGTLRPWGGSWEVNTNRWNFRDNCNVGKKPDNYTLCAGHVMENGLKVEYK